jgi:hypothetical protein
LTGEVGSSITLLSSACLQTAPHTQTLYPTCLHTHAGGRQKDFVETEKTLGRTDPAQISALVGYAGGQVRAWHSSACTLSCCTAYAAAGSENREHPEDPVMCWQHADLIVLCCAVLCCAVVVACSCLAVTARCATITTGTGPSMNDW